jgi:hypothetical protein
VRWREWRARALAPVDETRAWACLGMNAAMPGLGSALAGRFAAGAAQALLALAGAGACLWWIVLFVDEWRRLGHYPWGGGEHLVLGLLGIGLFAAGWLWSLATSAAVIRAARRNSRSCSGTDAVRPTPR